MCHKMIIEKSDKVLITGAAGFIGLKLVEYLAKEGFTNLCCFIRPSSNRQALESIAKRSPGTNIEIIEGNLLSRTDCSKAAEDSTLVYHLAASADKSFSGTFMNTTVTTRNLLDALFAVNKLKRFVNVSSFAVYSGRLLRKGKTLDEACPLEKEPLIRGPYCFGKMQQDELIYDYHRKHNIPYVIVRPGAVFGPGKNAITGRVGIDTFGIFIHLGGGHRVPLSYVDNCAEAIALSGLTPGVEGEVFNIVDDKLPTSRRFLKQYKKNVGRFRSLFVPWWASFLFCLLWEKYSIWSEGQIPLAFTRNRWAAEWKGHQYSNQKLKDLLGWKQTVSFEDACKHYYDYIKGYKHND